MWASLRSIYIGCFNIDGTAESSLYYAVYKPLTFKQYMIRRPRGGTLVGSLFAPPKPIRDT